MVSSDLTFFNSVKFPAASKVERAWAPLPSIWVVARLTGSYCQVVRSLKGLSRLLKLLEKDDIQIEFSYTAASESPGIAMMVFRFSDNSKAIKILEKNGLKLIKSNA